MPSAERGEAGGWSWLRSQGLGLACGLATAALLAVGSFVLAATRDGASAGIALDDVRPFFRKPSWIHTWFYLLCAVLALYAVNAALATWHSVGRKWRGGARAPSSYAAAVMHVAFLVALVAHGVGGLLGEERGRILLAAPWQPIGGEREARLLSLDVESLPGGMPKEVRARVEVRDGSGQVTSAVVGYNVPLSRGLGSELHLLAEMGWVPLAELSVGPERCSAPEGGLCRLAGQEIVLARIAPVERAGATPVAGVRVGGRPLLLVQGREAPLPDGRPLRLEGVRSSQAILLRSRWAPGNPWALAAALLLGAGVLLMWRRFLPVRSQAAREAEADLPAATPPRPGGRAR